jgi:very-short-patch-repair endonuclease
VDIGLVRRPIKGIYVLAETEDTLSLRLAVAKLVVPDGCVVTDRAAGWIWVGDRMLAPNQHLAVPTLTVFCKPGHRLRNGLTESGERIFLPRDLTTVGGLTVTTPLRTACDLGRLLHRDQAFAALDTLLGLGAFTLEELVAEVIRFKGYRGVIQLRAFAPLADPRSQSQFESILRLRWYDAGLPRPQLQVEVPTSWGTSYWLDIALPDELFAAEYDGEEFHGDEERDHDDSRRHWMSTERDWRIVVARNASVTGPHQDIVDRLASEWRLHQGRGR